MQQPHISHEARLGVEDGEEHERQEQQLHYINAKGQRQKLRDITRKRATLIDETIAATSADSNYSSASQNHKKQMEQKWAHEQPCTTDLSEDIENLNRGQIFKGS